MQTRAAKGPYNPPMSDPRAQASDTETGLAPGTVRAQFRAELDEVIRLVYSSLDEIYSPLRELAASHIRRVQPPVRAAAVLAAGAREDEPPSLRSRRTLLASALELLAVAINVHALLLNLEDADDASLDKSLVGSTILAGDYCFSRAAVLAAQTESPVVVEIFSQALKSVSEARLRGTFSSGHPGHNETMELVGAGVRAAAHLAGLSHESTTAALQVAAGLTAPATAGQTDLAKLSPLQQERWQAALAWLSENHSPV